MAEPNLKGVAGGTKQHWLRQNRELVMQYCETFGRESTLKAFTMEPETLERLYRQVNKSVPFTKVEKALLKSEIAIEASNELKMEVRQLRKEFSEFQQNVAGQVSRKVLIPWIQAAIQIAKEVEIEDNAVSETDLRDLQLTEQQKGDSERE